MTPLETAADRAFAPATEIATAMCMGTLAAEALARQRPRYGHR